VKWNPESCVKKIMKTILLFNKKYWTVLTINDYLEKEKCHEIRSGYSHIIVVLDKIDEKTLPDSDKEILCIQYSKKDEAAKNDIIRIKGRHRVVESLAHLALKPNNIIFDLRNFGYFPKSNKGLVAIYDDVVLDGNFDMLKIYGCRDLIECENIDDEVKKYLLDIYVFIASGIQILITMNSKDHVLKQYSIILANIFITGAKIEELMFLVLKIDDQTGYYQKFKKAKKGLISAFLGNTSNSKLEIVRKLRDIAENYELFTDKFRTPEGHKKGRIFSLVSQGHYGTLLNELLSFINDSNALFVDIVNYLRKENKLIDKE